MSKVVIVGGGVAGCGAALAAAKAGAKVTLLERTDMLFGVAVSAGETNGNGNFVANHELRFLGVGELSDALLSIKLHDGVQFPDSSRHVFIFNSGLAEPLLKRIVKKAGIEVLLETRAMDVKKEDGQILAVKLADGRMVEGDAFVDCTGGHGGISVCVRYGKGCVMCNAKCPSFGDRIGMVEKAGGKVYDMRRPDGMRGQVGKAITVFKDTLAPKLKARLEREGLLKIPLPSEMVDYSKHALMGGLRTKDFLSNLILTDIGPVAKLSGLGYMRQEELRQVPGFENVSVESPQASRYNHISSVAIAFRDSTMRVKGFENLFCGGEKAGHSSVEGAMISGILAGHNAARNAFNLEPLVLPVSMAMGDFFAYTTEQYKTVAGRNRSYHMGFGEYWERMQQTGLYTDDVKKIKRRVKEAGLLGAFSQKMS